MPSGVSKEEAQAMFDQAVQILKEDAGLAQNRALMARLDAIEKQTKKTPQTPEEKAAAYDELMAQGGSSGNGGMGHNPPTTSNPPSPNAPAPPNPKPAAQSQESTPDWWWGSSDS